MWMTSGDYILPSARTAITGGGDPTSYWEAINSMGYSHEDKNALVENDLWELVDCHKNVKVINKSWVLWTKLNAYGLTKWLRTRQVMKGHVRKGRNWIRGELQPCGPLQHSMCCACSCCTGEMTAFLYSTLQEEGYTCQPEGFDSDSGWVCKLKRSLYSLKQASRGWNQHFVDFMKKKRVKLSTTNPCLFVCQHNGNS